MRINIKSTYRLIRRNWKRLVVLEVIYKLNFFFLLIPFISLCFNTALSFTKYSYITTENLVRFLTYPQTMLALVLVIIMTSLFLLMEVASLLYFFEDCKNNAMLNPFQLVIAGGKTMCSVLRRRMFLVPLCALFMSAFLNLPMIMLLVSEGGISSYLMRALFSDGSARVIFGVVVFILFWVSYRHIFILPICILDKRTYREARKSSLAYTKEKRWTVLFQLIGTNLILTLVFIPVYLICCGILLLMIHLFSEPHVQIPLFLQNYKQLNRIVFVCISILGAIVNFALISTLYVRISKPKIQEFYTHKPNVVVRNRIRLRRSMRRRVKQAAVVLACLCAVTTYSYFYNMLRNGTFNAEQSLIGLQITAHRGNSIEAPENTLPALQKAIDCYADYAEIDVQLTKDGEVILCHDSNLYRTGGVRKKISKLTYGQLLKYDVGGWYSEEYIGTTVPTLAQVLELCKGKIKLNIELKRIHRQRELVEKVIGLIQEYEFERQCVITSMSYEALKLVKETDDTIKTGYIMSLAYGNFYENENIDFFSMKAAIVTEDIVRMAHKRGKEVHVWTVNTRDEITRLSALGVDNLITDKPLYVQKVLYQVDDTSLLQYLRMIVKKFHW